MTDAPDSRLRRTLRYGSYLLCAAVAAALVWAWPAPLGGTSEYIIVSGTSMQPTYQTGDLVVLRPQDNYSVGDVMAYRVPEGLPGAGHNIIHRVIGGDAASGWLLQGDNRDTRDPYRPAGGDVLGTPVFHLDKAGILVANLRHPIVLSAIAALFVTAALWPRAESPSKAPGNPNKAGPTEPGRPHGDA